MSPDFSFLPKTNYAKWDVILKKPFQILQDGTTAPERREWMRWAVQVVPPPFLDCGEVQETAFSQAENVCLAEVRRQRLAIREARATGMKGKSIVSEWGSHSKSQELSIESSWVLAQVLSHTWVQRNSTHLGKELRKIFTLRGRKCFRL